MGRRKVLTPRRTRRATPKPITLSAWLTFKQRSRSGLSLICRTCLASSVTSSRAEMLWTIYSHSRNAEGAIHSPSCSGRGRRRRKVILRTTCSSSRIRCLDSEECYYARHFYRTSYITDAVDHWPQMSGEFSLKDIDENNGIVRSI